MNFLAHLHVGRHLDPDESAGNLLADYCKDVGNGRFRRGVWFHRRIDSFTDRNEVAGEARALFNASYRHFGGVLSDLAFDWCLARTWDEWSPNVDLLGFIENSLKGIQKSAVDLPDHAAFALERMIEERWLESYRDIDGMRQTLVRISRRRPIVKMVLGAERLMQAHESELTRIFRRFYPQLLKLGQTDEARADELVENDASRDQGEGPKDDHAFKRATHPQERHHDGHEDL